MMKVIAAQGENGRWYLYRTGDLLVARGVSYRDESDARWYAEQYTELLAQGNCPLVWTTEGHA